MAASPPGAAPPEANAPAEPRAVPVRVDVNVNVNVNVSVNGREHRVPAALATPLLTVLRNHCGCNGPKYGCGLGECGACLVLIDGVAARSCTVPLAAVAGATAREVTTLEGLGSRNAPHPVQQAFIDEQAAQCGYCLNGMVIATVALLSRNAQPSDDEVRAALSHNLCRCGAHVEILRAVQRAAASMRALQRVAMPPA